MVVAVSPDFPVFENIEPMHDPSRFMDRRVG
jgi:hypothetical protein